MIGNVNVPGALAADIANKVDKISGKGLSTNDFTNEYKSKLDNMVTGGVSGDDINDLKAMVLPKLALTGTEGTEFTLTKGANEITGELDENGEAEVFVPELGTWLCEYELSGRTGSKNIVFSAPMTLVEEEIELPPIIPAIFADATWEQIDYATANDLVPNTWNIGDEKDITIGNETITLQIYDFNHDDLTAGGKAGITFGLKNLMATEIEMNSTHTNSGGFTSSVIYSWLQGNLYNSLPSDLKSVIKVVNKKTSAGSQSSTINTNSMKIFLFSEVECFGTMTYSYPGEGSQYPIFTDNASRIKKLSSNGVVPSNGYWERSPKVSNSTGFCIVNSDGSAAWLNDPTFKNYVNFGFCV